MILTFVPSGFMRARETTDPDMPVVTALSRDGAGIDDLLPVRMHIRAAHAEGFARTVGEERAGVALVKIPLPIRPSGDASEGCDRVAAVEAGQQHFALVDGRIETPSRLTSV